MKRGRPTVLTDEVMARIAELRGRGWGYKRIAWELKIGRTTVRRVLGKTKDAGGGRKPQVESGGSAA